MAAAQAEEAIAKYEASNPGKVPGSIKQALKQKLRPTPDPFAQLRSAVCTSVASPVGGRDYSHRRRSRKQPPGDDAPLLHGRITVQPHAVVIVDTSASMMTKDIQAKALSVIAQGLRKLGRVKVYCADTKVQSHALVATTRVFDWHGGGGTDMSTAIEEVERTDKPDSIVLITDAETNWHGPKPRARVVVAYTGEKGSSWHNAIPHWARVVPLSQEGA
jgi:predicted metal-dependent peptidase